MAESRRSGGDASMILSRTPRRSAKQARNLILDLARYGNHSHNIPVAATEESLAQWFTDNGHPFPDLIEQLRDPIRPVPFVENLIGSDWVTFGVGSGTWDVIDSDTGEVLSSLSAPGVQSLLSYHSQFDQAIRTLEDAITKDSYQELLQAVATGIACLETFVSDQVRKWNAQNPSSKILDAPPFASFDVKVGDWFPIMLHGKRYNKSGKDWDALQRLRDLRNNQAIHPKSFAQGTTFVDLADWCNVFTLGIPETLFQMHVIFSMRVPTSIIRARYATKVVVQEL